MRFFLLVLIGIFLPLSVSAEVLTSIKVDDNRYNLVIFDAKEHERPIDAFNEALRRENRLEVIKDCSLAIDMPAGTARGNDSYGGYCSYLQGRETKYVTICADKMVGHLEVQLRGKYWYLDEDDGIDDLAKFVTDHCVGG